MKGTCRGECWYEGTSPVAAAILTKTSEVTCLAVGQVFPEALPARFHGQRRQGAGSYWSWVTVTE